MEELRLGIAMGAFREVCHNLLEVARHLFGVTSPCMELITHATEALRETGGGLAKMSVPVPGSPSIKPFACVRAAEPISTRRASAARLVPTNRGGSDEDP